VVLVQLRQVVRAVLFVEPMLQAYSRNSRRLLKS
jgi:hypothetical protein